MTRSASPMQNFRDYYALLGIPQSADQAAIKAAFRKLARQCHPDLNPGDRQAEERFKQISEAYEILSDPDRRAEYQRFSRYWQQQGAASVGSDDDYGDFPDFDIFVDELLGRRTVERSPRRSARRSAATSSALSRDLERSLEVDPKTALQGGSAQLQLEDGRLLEVDIPAGIQAGEYLRLRGQGIKGGDLLLRVQLQASNFQVQGSDVIYTLNVSPAMAVLGGQVTVPTLDGPVQMKLPASLRSGQRLRLAGKGYSKPSGDRGDQIVVIQLQLPTRLSPEERQLYEQLRSLEQSR
ncbi:DnaJ C-terminal domain-containing protein [Synechococcus elongatus]|nr:DnaJ C-terminal domain-containing protein [Synechococcus elongatus]ABB58609.1 Heat shock protein DnaJ-like [Synechococcus elongatus PCC 7942 = FACHB-805]MBD2587830.1 DnaJ domain-containing protein [Synechococcus elongatus FACHB-242]MBD2688898.1 DnaJ domain-containing protein [Synechococcus elongatus FACHB-1061]MBD2707462.1 DnaJ domain-containing protein [Synechococcus elongatus PCC 7942 = FACHB-805]UOW72407.1 curved DNA-binding protein [Synechococcus elongatus PCC 7943]